MQKPTLCIYETTRAYACARVYNTPMGIYHYLFSKTKFETSYIPRGQKQALVNAFKYAAPSPCDIYADTPA